MASRSQRVEAQQITMDLPAGKAGRDAGIAQVAFHNEEWMDVVMVGFATFCREHQEVTVEKFREWWAARGGAAPKHHNAWGAVGCVAVKRKMLELIDWRASVSKKSHARRMPYYRSLLFVA